MSIVDLADEKLGARDVVRPNRIAVGDAVAEHADARHGDRLSGNVFDGRDKHFRGPRHHAAVRSFRRAVYRPGKTLPGAERFETARGVLSRELFSADVSEIRGWALSL